MLPFPAMKSIDAVVDFAKQANEYAERLQEQGLGLYYHNHHIEFAKFDGKYMLDIIAENSPAMGMEIDVHWVQRGGLDPVRTLEKYAGRTAMVHLKDYRIGELPRVRLRAAGIRGLRGLHGRVQERGPVRRSGRRQPGLRRPSSRPRRPPAPSTCWWSRTNSTAAPSGTPCRPPTTTWWPWATPTSSRLPTQPNELRRNTT